jgi:hypothetical protein
VTRREHLRALLQAVGLATFLYFGLQAGLGLVVPSPGLADELSAVHCAGAAFGLLLVACGPAIAARFAPDPVGPEAYVRIVEIVAGFVCASAAVREATWWVAAPPLWFDSLTPWSLVVHALLAAVLIADPRRVGRGLRAAGGWAKATFGPIPKRD